MTCLPADRWAVTWCQTSTDWSKSAMAITNCAAPRCGITSLWKSRPSPLPTNGARACQTIAGQVNRLPSCAKDHRIPRAGSIARGDNGTARNETNDPIRLAASAIVSHSIINGAQGQSGARNAAQSRGVGKPALILPPTQARNSRYTRRSGRLRFRTWTARRRRRAVLLNTPPRRSASWWRFAG